MSATIAAAPGIKLLSSRQCLFIAAGLGALLLAIQRLWLAQDLPLWIDETWTAVIANQPTWSDFWREAWLDCNPPLYYLFMAIWTELAGLSNAALRAPSFAFVALAAAVPLLVRVPGLTKEARVCWAALLYFWWHAGILSADARVYGMLLFISTAQTIAYVQLLDAPSTRRALGWAALASAAILSHYYALFLAAVQGALYLALHRDKALRTWPAALAFVPSFAWLATHLPRLADYARPDVAWYVPLTLAGSAQQISFVLGARTYLFAAAAILGLLATWYMIRKRGVGSLDAKPRQPGEQGRYVAWAAASALFAFVLILGVAIIKPTLTTRYLTPLVPPVMLGIVLIVGRLHGSARAYTALVLVFFAGSVPTGEIRAQQTFRGSYGFQRVSEELMKTARPNQVVFAWDHPAAKILDQNSMRQLGGFFFGRAGADVETVPIIFQPGEDPNIRLTAEANADRSSIIWLYNVARQSSARDFPPRISEMDGWSCTHSTSGPTGIVACAPDRLLR